MADTKISALTDGVALESTDRLIVARSPFASGDNRYVTGAQVAAFAGSGREVLLAARTYFVRTDGDDANNGLTNSAGGAFETIQRACDVISNDIDRNGQAVTVKIGAGNYAGFSLYDTGPSGSRTNSKVLFIANDGLTNADVHVTSASYVSNIWIQIEEIDFQHVIWAEPYTKLELRDTRWTVFGNVYITPFVFVHFNGVTTIGTDSSMFKFVYFDGAPSELVWDGSIVLTGTPAWSVAFLDLGIGGTVQWAVTTTTGVTATGDQALVEWRSNLIAVDGGDLTEIPGTANSIDYGKLLIDITGSDGAAIRFPSPNNDTVIQHYSRTFQDDLLITDTDLFLGAEGSGPLFAANISIANADNEAIRTRADAFLFPQIQFHADATNGTQSNANMALHKWSADAVGPVLAFAKSRANSIGTYTVVQNGDVLGEILWNGSDGTDNEVAAGIRAIVDGTPGANDMPTTIVVSVTADAGATATDRFRIKPDGGVIVGTGTTSGGAGTIIAEGFVKTLSTTVGALPSAATAGAGARAFVTDANSTTFLATAAGGGANAVPVVSNGTNWVIG
jgi:hypothetical protein